jgi:catechol 2,3-dioxygenase-like lactoylglutathione lyase family enzyme
MITGMAHICFTVADLDRSRKFYEGALGFKHAFDFKRDTGEIYGHYFHIGGRCFIELFKGPVEPPIKGQSYRHFCLEVDDIQATVKTLRERGVEVGEIKLGDDQSWQAWLADPDGNRIELHQYTPQSWQAPSLR